MWMYSSRVRKSLAGRIFGEPDILEPCYQTVMKTGEAPPGAQQQTNTYPISEARAWCF
jgi:hypothetical protein